MVDEKIVDLLKEDFSKAGQGHVFDFYSTLNKAGKLNLINKLKSVNLKELTDELNKREANENQNINWDTLKPANYIPLPKNENEYKKWEAAKVEGEKVIKSGRLAVFTVAGGQGTRLGFDGPKGSFQISLVSKKSLFEVFSDKIYRATKKYEVKIPWFIMTSEINHESTIQFFKQNNYFGLSKDNVYFFTQSLFPAVDFDGKILMDSKSSIVLTPNGHGGSIKALYDSGALAIMENYGKDIISYFQVDNPLVSCIDPSFVGFHVLNKSEFSSKMIKKIHPLEKVGVFCEHKNKNIVIEYSDMPEENKKETKSDGTILFHSGNIAIHLFNREFIKRLGSQVLANSMPYHRAYKKIPFINNSGVYESPKNNNGIKFEMFIFDALQKANKSIIIEALRNENFSPLKNMRGEDSYETCKRDLLSQVERWLIASGQRIKVNQEKIIEINYRFAMDEEDFISQWKNLKNKPKLKHKVIIE